MANQHRVWIEVDVTDLDLLKAYARSRAVVEGGITDAEFEDGEHVAEDRDLNIAYWLGWAFDAGTPVHCGFEIIASGVEDQN